MNAQADANVQEDKKDIIINGKTSCQTCAESKGAAGEELFFDMKCNFSARKSLLYPREN